jgi:hypothetical protein
VLGEGASGTRYGPTGTDGPTSGALCVCLECVSKGLAVPRGAGTCHRRRVKAREKDGRRPPLCLARTRSDPAQTSSRLPTHTHAVLTPLERPETMSPSSPRAIVSPSVLASNFAQLGDEIRRMMKCGAEWVHMGASAPIPLRAAAALLDATSPQPTSLADP